LKLQHHEDRSAAHVTTMAADDLTIDDAWNYVKSAVLAGWSKTTKPMRAAGMFMIFVYAIYNPSMDKGTN